ncbi:M4 family metallopeptidase [Phycicoccus flavus]|uniref:Neutral metalloproteinase n=1 Tax=Phycicoccus flavus TaxID=2502783 RepID=A0A8T6R3V6_9MICO|nr:M4 family metallopeptidase [Phycicoccus flavus]NHA68526.1 M4 family metallopeptidase [Phycicoccus flavus]
MSHRILTGTAVTVAVAAALAGGVAPGASAGSDPSPRADEQRAAGATARALGLGADQSLTVRSVVTDADGTRHVHYDRTLDGMPVVGGDLVLAKRPDGSVGDQHWAAAKDVAPAAERATLARSVAEATARSGAGYRVERTSSDLVVYAAQGAPRLAWQVTTEGVRASQTPSRLKTWVDARSGTVLGSAETIVEGTGNTQYSGTVTLSTITGTGGYRLRDTVGNHTTDLNGATSGTGTEFTDADDVWGNGTTSSRQTAGADAQWGAQETYAYYNDVQGRKGIWDTGVGARSRVHYGNAYNNAFWDGTQMTYGDGAGNAKPLTSIDVAGHEMSHGVTENTAGLNYRGESGGLNEATSDIFGTAVEFHAGSAADPGDYLIGEKIDINGNGTPLRYMDRPSRDGRSADCWSKQVGRLDVHYSSGPLNHWFYLVSEGSGAKTVNGVAYNSPTCNGSSMSGVGHSVAEKVWYRTLSTKLVSTSTYKSARDGAIASAKELYGTGSAECAAVRNGFDAIAVPAGTQTCTT